MARRENMVSEVLGDDLDKLWPLIGDGQSDSATFDNALELLVAGGYPARPRDDAHDPGGLGQQPADEQAPARVLRVPRGADGALGRTGGGGLHRRSPDRRDAGPQRAAPGPLPGHRRRRRGHGLRGRGARHSAGAHRQQVAPAARARCSSSTSSKARSSTTRRSSAGWPRPSPTAGGSTRPRSSSRTSRRRSRRWRPPPAVLLDRQQAFGYTQEDLKFFLGPMAAGGQDPVGSMGRDFPIAVLSDRPKLLYDYFTQCFAQVTNPPIDPIREQLVMSLTSLVGPRPNLLDLDTGGSHRRLEVRQPILSNVDLEKIRHIHERVDNAFRTYTLDICFVADLGASGMRGALERVCREAREKVQEGFNIIILSDRAIDADHVAIPALLATSAVHHHLIRAGLRTRGGARGRDRRGPPGARLLSPRGLRGGGDQPLPRLRDDLRAARERAAAADRDAGAPALHRRDGQGHPQGHVEDGDLDLPVLLRRADLRRGRPARRLRRRVLLRHPVAGRGRRTRRDRARRRCAATASPTEARPSTSTPSTSAASSPQRQRGEAHMWTSKTISTAPARGAPATTSRPTSSTHGSSTSAASG